MKIAETYFQRLINSNDPLAAVTELDRLWTTREGVSRSADLFGLARPEYIVHLALMYDSEVGNGGHLQFLGNPGGAYALETAEALTELGLTIRAAALTSACAVFPGGVVPADDDVRDRLTERFTGAQRRLLSDLDSTVYRSTENVDSKCLAYLRLHKDEILLPERAA